MWHLEIEDNKDIKDQPEVAFMANLTNHVLCHIYLEFKLKLFDAF